MCEHSSTLKAPENRDPNNAEEKSGSRSTEWLGNESSVRDAFLTSIEARSG